MKKSKLIKTFTAIALGATSIGVIIPIINQITTSTNVNSKSKLNITAKQTDDYKMSSLDMLAAKVYTYARDMQGLSEDEAEAQVTHTCGIYNHMYNQQVQQMTQNRQSPNDDTQYGIIQSLNNQFNIDPLDADGMQSNILPNIKTTLENQGQTPAQAQQVVDNYQSVVNEMQDDLPTNLDVAMQYNTEFQPATANENNLDLVCT
jgi:hypothetical protein